MKYFYGVVHKDDDSAFGVHFPDLPGCYSAADGDADIIANAAEALSLWFEDQPMVEPGTLADITAKAQGDIADGAFIIRVPYIGATGMVVRFNVSLDKAMLGAIDAAAASRNMTRSGFLVEAARREIESVS